MIFTSSLTRQRQWVGAMAFGLLLVLMERGLQAGTSPLITSVTLTNGQLQLEWQDGRPMYQLQARGDLNQSWTNVGQPTSDTSRVIETAGDQTFYRVVADFTALYEVTFEATWSQATHPSNWPANPHFSGLVGGTHNDSVHFFRIGESATEGIRLMAELGQKSTLLSEISPAIANGTAHFQLSGGGINPSPASVSLVFPEPMRRDHPLVTLVSMIAPSPDWFVGVESLSLIEAGHWVSNKVVTLYGMDAGTDSGVTYDSPNLQTIPRGVVTEFTDFPALVDGVIVPFGTFTFERLD